jgi:hypothetical protein
MLAPEWISLPADATAARTLGPTWHRALQTIGPGPRAAGSHPNDVSDEYRIEPDTPPGRALTRNLLLFSVLLSFLVLGFGEFFRGEVRREVAEKRHAPNSRLEALNERMQKILDGGVDRATGEQPLPIDAAMRVLTSNPELLRPAATDPAEAEK